MKERKTITKRLASMALCLAIIISMGMPGMTFCDDAEAAAAPAQAEAPVEAAAPVQEEAPAEADAAPAESPAVTETPAPAESPAVTETPAPTESPAPTVSPAPSEKPEDKEEKDGETEPKEEAPELEDTTLTATDGASGTTVFVSGMLPVGAYATITAVEVPQLLMETLKLSLSEEGAQNQSTIAFDVSIYDAEGREIEPSGIVNVEFKFGASSPMDAAAAESMSIVHLKEDGNGQVCDLIEVEAQTAMVAGQVEASFQTDSFSTFVITWGGLNILTDTYFTVNINYKNTNGGPIEESQIYSKQGSVTSGTRIDLSGAENSQYIPTLLSGLTYKSTTLGGQPVGSMETIWDWMNGGLPTVRFYKPDGSFLSDYVCQGRPITIDIDVTYEVTEIAPPTQEETTAKHNKTATDKGDGSYDITLDISGAASTDGAAKKMDVLLIIDRSSSMRDPFGSDQTRIQAVKNTAGSLIQTLAGNKNIDANFAVVTFSKTAQIHQPWTDKAAEATSAVNGINPKRMELFGVGDDDGTNYQEGIMEGINVGSSRANAEKVVVFLTDGTPNMWKDRWIIGSTDTAQSYAEASIQGLSCNQFYAIDVGGEAGTARLESLASNVGKAGTTQPSTTGVYSASSTAELEAAFAGIAGNSDNFLCSNVVITDELSENVDPTDVELVIKVTKEGADGQVEEVALTTEPIENGIEATLPDRETKITATLKNRTVEMKFVPENYQLEKGWTYSVTANVKPSEKAYENYRKNNCAYLDKADEGTGTHADAGELGLYSNGPAKVTYTYKGEVHDVDYPKPVIQLDPAKLIIEKTFTGLSEDEIKEVLNNLSFDVTLNGKKENYPMSRFEPKDGKYVYVIEGLSPETTYSVEEKGTDLRGYSVKASWTNQTGTLEAGKEVTVSVTNAYTPNTLTITKSLTALNRKMGDDASFLFEARNNDTGEVYTRLIHFTGKGSDSVVIEGVPSGNYTVTELAAAGYQAIDGYTREVTINADNPNGTAGFTNSPVSGPYGDSSSAKNVLTSDGAGGWTVTQDNSDGNQHD